MKILSGIALVAITLSLAACGKGEEGAKPSGDPIAAVPAPAGTSWSETVNKNADGYYVMGNPDAKLKLLEFGSYTCSHCRDFSEEASPEIRKIVDSGKMSYEFRPFLRDSIDMTAALLADCGGQDVFYPMTEQLFANQTAMFDKIQSNEAAFKAVDQVPAPQRPFAIAQIIGLIEFAQQRGVSADQAKQCLANGETATRLAKGVEAAGKQYNIEGTPTFILNGAVVENASTWATLQPRLKDAGI